MPLQNFDNLLLPMGVLLLAYFLTSGTKEDDWQDEFGTGDDPYGSVRGGGMKFSKMLGDAGSWRPLPGYAVTIARSDAESAFSKMIESVKDEGGDVTRRLIEEGRMITNDMERGLQSLQETLAVARDQEERKFMDQLQNEHEEFYKKYGDMDSVAEQFMLILDKRKTDLGYTLKNTEPMRMFTEKQVYTQDERIDLWHAVDSATSHLRRLVQYACDVFAQSRELMQNFHEPSNEFDEVEDDQYSSEGERHTQQPTSGAIPQSAPNLTNKPSFESFKPSKSRLSRDDLETTVTQLDFDSPLERQSFDNIPESPVNERSDQIHVTTPSPHKYRAFAKTYAKRKVGVDGNADFDASTPSQMFPPRPDIPGSAPAETFSEMYPAPPEVPGGGSPAGPPNTPLRNLYESATDYVRETTKLLAIMESSEKAVSGARGDEQILGEVKRRLQGTQPPEFLKGEWFGAAMGKTSAMLSNGQSMSFGDLMKDQVFNDYQELVKRVNIGLL